MIDIQNVTVRFGGLIALDSVTACLQEPIVGLVGPNGAGKTTLLNVISGFLASSGGLVSLNGTALNGLSVPNRARLGMRRTFQQELVVLDLTARENILAVADHLTSGGAEREIARALEFTGLGAVADKRGSALNLFQRRMVEIAKALIGHPKLILLDEPAAGLNDAESRMLRDTVRRLPHEFGVQVVLIDHDTQLISDLCIETVVLDFGRLLAFGPTRKVLEEPAVRAAYLGAVAT